MKIKNGEIHVYDIDVANFVPITPEYVSWLEHANGCVGHFVTACRNAPDDPFAQSLLVWFEASHAKKRAEMGLPPKMAA